MKSKRRCKEIEMEKMIIEMILRHVCTCTCLNHRFIQCQCHDIRKTDRIHKHHVLLRSSLGHARRTQIWVLVVLGCIQSCLVWYRLFCSPCDVFVHRTSSASAIPTGGNKKILPVVALFMIMSAWF